MLQAIEKEIGLKVRGFKWLGPFQKTNQRHILEFYGWSGEIFVRDKGIRTNREYYKDMLEKGYCLYIEGMVVAKTGFSDHYNALHKEYLKRMMQMKAACSQQSYPVVNPEEQVIFESAVQLYQQGIFDLKQLQVRIKRYIQLDKQDEVLLSLTKVPFAS